MGTDEPDVTLPVAGASFDYQIGGSYPPHPETRVVSRDRGADQPRASTASAMSTRSRPGATSCRGGGRPTPTCCCATATGEQVVDQAWDEVLLDVSTPDARRTALADVVGARIDRCAADGFDAVEPDNLDSYRTLGRPAQLASDAVAFVTLLAERAHSAGLAIAQKNDTGWHPKDGTIGFDFAVVEEC